MSGGPIPLLVMPRWRADRKIQGLAGGAGCGSLAAMSTLSLVRRAALSCAAFSLLVPSASFAQGEEKPRTPSQIVAEAPAPEWVRIAPSDLVVMQLAPDAKGRERRVVIQLMPAPFSQGWVGNIRTLVAARWYDGVSVNRVQDNYVVQWGDANGEDAGKAKALPEGLRQAPEADYIRKAEMGMISDPIIHGYEVYPAIVAREGPKYSRPNLVSVITVDELQNGSAPITAQPVKDSYVDATGFYNGWPMAGTQEQAAEKSRFADFFPHLMRQAWPTHCYGMVGVGRNLSPDTGTGAELYVVIGHAPRHLDRNIALVGRVIEGIEHLSSLPRGTGPLGFYENAEERVPILSVRMGDETPDLPFYEYLDTNKDSFAAYAHARANRQDEFFIRPAGGADICNIPVPIRRKG